MNVAMFARTTNRGLCSIITPVTCSGICMNKIRVG